MEKLKYVMAFLIAMSVTLCGLAAKPTAEDTDNYKASIMSFVKSEGYMPRLDSDGDIEFKHDGDAYWVETYPYDDGYYVAVYTITKAESYTINKVRKAMDETMASLKFVRLYSRNANDVPIVIVSYGWYCISIVDFKRMFSDALTVVATADSRFISKLTED